MSLVSYWPALGVLVPFPGPSDAPLSSSGAQAAPTNYLTNLVQDGRLLTSNPAGTAPAPIEYFQYAIYCTTLMSSTGAFGGQVVDAIGYRTKADGGQGQFTWDATSTVTADNGIVFGAQPVGRWVRVRPSKELNVRWFGAYGDGTHDDAPAIRAAIASAQPQTSKIFYPYGHYGVGSTIVVNGLLTNGLRFEGEAAAGNDAQWSSIDWIGPSSATPATSVMFDVTGYDHIFSQLLIRNDAYATGVVARCGISLGKAGCITTHVRLDRCTISGFEIGVAIDLANDQGSNIENCGFTDCYFAAYDAGIWIRGAQPYGTFVERCVFLSTPPPGVVPGANAYGVGIRVGDSSGVGMACTLWVRQATFSYLAYGVQCLGTPQQLTMQGLDSENTKRLLSHTGPNGFGTTFSIDGGRFALSAVANLRTGMMYVPSLGGTPAGPWEANISTGDINYIKLSSGNLTLKGCSFYDNTTPQPNFAIAIDGQCNLVSEGCTYTNNKPFVRGASSQLSAGYAWNGRTFSRGDNVLADNPELPPGTLSIRSAPVLNGTENGGGTVTITGAATSATVTFLCNEPLNQPAVPSSCLYRVSFSIDSITGTPTVTAPYMSNKLKTGFTVNLPTAPGVGNSITISYVMWRD